MIGVYEEYNIRLANLLPQIVSLLGQGRGIDDSGGDIFRCSYTRRYGDLGKDRLDLVGNEDIFDEGGDQAALPGPFIPADTYAN